MDERERKTYERKVALFKRYKDFATNKATGENWVNFLRDIFVPNSLLTKAAAWQIAVWALHLPISYWTIVILIFFYNWAWLALNFIIGWLTKKIGIWQYSSEYDAKQAHISPWNVEAQKTLTSIAEKMGAKNYFKEL